VSREGHAGALPHRHAHCGGRAPRPHSWLWAVAALAFVIALNPVTAERYARSHFIVSWAVGLLWTLDLLVLVLAVLLSRGRRPHDAGARSPLRALVVGVLLGLLCLEGLLRLFPVVALPDSLERERSWRASHSAPGNWATARWNIDEFSPLVGWQPKPNLRTPSVTTNSSGLRGTREYSPHRPPGVRRVLCVGDSFTFGEGLADNEAMPAQLEAELNRAGPGSWEVLNLGVHGYGTDQQWLRLQAIGFHYDDDVVVLGFFQGDLERNVMSFRDYAKPYFEIVDDRLALRNVPVPPPEEVLSRRFPSPALYITSLVLSGPERLRLALSVGDLAETRAGRVTLHILDAMREAVLSRGAQFVLMFIPRPITPQGSDTERMLLRWGEATGTPMVNLRTAYLKLPAVERERLYNGHWTRDGAHVTAGLLAAALRHHPS